MVVCVLTLCSFAPARKGAVLTYGYYDVKGKVLRDDYKDVRFLRFMVEEVWTEGDTVVNFAIENEALARKIDFVLLKPAIEGLSYGDVRVTPTEVVFENMQWLFSPLPGWFAWLGEYDDVDHYGTYVLEELSATSRLPRVMNIGDALPDENFRALFVEKLSEKMVEERERDREEREVMRGFGRASRQRPIADSYEVTAKVRNRRVEGLERVSVPAGEWECWKISYESVGPVEKRVGMEWMHDDEREVAPAVKHVDYVSPEIGLVKREVYNNRGRKVVEIMQLDSIK